MSKSKGNATISLGSFNSERSYLLLTGIIAAIYFVFSTFSVGYYTHDEIGQFLNMQDFWLNWEAILGLWTKPGWKVLYALPSLLGWKFVVVVNCIVTAMTAYVAGLVAKDYGLKDRTAVMLICAFMSMWYQISFRNYSELPFGLILISSIYFIRKEKFILGAILASWLFAMRQEGALFAVFLGLLFIRDRRFIPFLFLGTSPILWNLAGFISNGDPLFILNLVGGGVGEYAQAGFFHLWSVYLPLAGPVVYLLSVIGLLGFVAHVNGAKKYLVKYELLYIGFVPIFLFYCLMTEPAFPYLKLMSNWKMVAPFAPILAIFSAIGLRFLKTQKHQKHITYAYILIGALLAFGFIWASYDHNYIFYNESSRNFTAPVFATLIGLVLIFYRRINIKSSNLGLICAVIGMIYTITAEKPIPLSSEDSALQQTAEWFDTNHPGEDYRIYYSHSVLAYFRNTNSFERKRRYIKVNPSNLEEVRSGDFLVWESHHSKRRGKLDRETIQEDPSYQLEHQILTDDRRFYIAVFRKL